MVVVLGAACHGAAWLCDLLRTSLPLHDHHGRFQFEAPCPPQSLALCLLGIRRDHLAGSFPHGRPYQSDGQRKIKGTERPLRHHQQPSQRFRPIRRHFPLPRVSSHLRLQTREFRDPRRRSVDGVCRISRDQPRGCL